MLLYTIYPQEMVLDGYESFSPEYIELEYEGCQVVVEILSPTSGKIVRLISSVSQNYLDPSLQPGVVMSLNYFKKPQAKTQKA